MKPPNTEYRRVINIPYHRNAFLREQQILKNSLLARFITFIRGAFK
jgi:hypothetical protein